MVGYGFPSVAVMPSESSASRTCCDGGVSHVTLLPL